MQNIEHLWSSYKPANRRERLIKQSAGFTLPEVIAALAMMGIITAISVPAWQSYHNRVRLSIGQDQVLQIMRQSQTKAGFHHLKWQASFREVDGRVQGAIHPADALPSEIVWENLYRGLKIDTQRTTLPAKSGIYRVQFNQDGNVNGQLGRLTLMSEDNSRLRSCVIVSTLIGALRSDREVNAKDRGCSPKTK